MVNEGICRICEYVVRSHSYRLNSDVKHYCSKQKNNRTKTKMKRIKVNDIACEMYVKTNLAEPKGVVK